MCIHIRCIFNSSFHITECSSLQHSVGGGGRGDEFYLVKYPDHNPASLFLPSVCPLCDEFYSESVFVCSICLCVQQISLVTQLTGLAVQYCTVMGLQYFHTKNR